jgi:hypothetical protein
MSLPNEDRFDPPSPQKRKWILRKVTSFSSRTVYGISGPIFVLMIAEVWIFRYMYDLRYVNRGIFLAFFDLCTVFNTASSAAPQIPLVSENAGIEPRTVATSALAVRRSNH